MAELVEVDWKGKPYTEPYTEMIGCVALKIKKAMNVFATDPDRFGVILFNRVFCQLPFDTAHASTEWSDMPRRSSE